MNCRELLKNVAEFQKGYAFKSKDYQESGRKIVKVSNLKDDSIELEGCICIDENKAQQYERYELEKDDIIISTVGSWPTNPASVVGKVVRVREDANNSLLNQNAVRVRGNNKVNQRYLYYLLKSNLFKSYIVGTAQGSASQASITQEDIKSFEFKLHSNEEQDKIVAILYPLDKKIELNNEMNKTLEEMAQALFKRWFVDFEFPNEDALAYKTSGGELVESELGFIPKGWIVGKVRELGKVITGKTPPTKDFENYGDEYNFITPVDMNAECFIVRTQRSLSKIGYDKVKNFIIRENSIGVTCIGSNLGEVYINSSECFTNQQINSLILENEKHYPYVYITFKNMKKDFLNIAGGSAVPIINKSAFSDINIIIPSGRILEEFSDRVIGIFNKIKENLIENENLKELRDSLLPKLMSGEIRIEDIEANLY